MLTDRLSPRAYFGLLSLLLVALLALLSRNSWWQSLEERLFAPVWQVYASSEPERRVVVVDIDERSLRSQGAWPWSRQTIARLIDQTAQAGAAVVLVDMILPEKRPGDEHLASVLARRPVVMGQIFSSADKQLAFANVGVLSSYGAASLPAGRCPDDLIGAGSYLANERSLGVRHAGHISPAVDPDGTVRRIPAVVCFQGKTYPALSLAGLALLSEAQSAWLLDRASGARRGLSDWLGPAHWIENPALPGLRLPVESDGLTRIPFSRSRSAYAAVSASEVLAGRAMSFDGAIVLIGASAFGVSDSVPVPLSGLATGMEVHLQMLSGLLDQRVAYRPAHQLWIDLLVVVLMTGGIYLAWRGGQRVASGWRSLLPTVVAPALVLLVLGLQVWAFASAGLWTFHLSVLVYPLLLALVLLAVRQWQLNRQRNRAMAHLQAFAGGGALAEYLGGEANAQAALSAGSLTQYLQNRPDPRVTPVSASILFADLCGFTAFYARHPEDAVARLIHQFYGSADWVVSAHGGAIDKYLGDGFMAVFLGELHAQRAVVAAIELQGLWAHKQDADGMAPLQLKMGIDSGDVLTGVFGSGQRLTHTVFGQPVNQAAHLEGLTRELNQSVLISEQTHSDLEEDRLRRSFAFAGRFDLGGALGAVGVFVLKD